MTKDKVVAFRAPDGFSPDPLTDLLRQGARQLIAQAVETELNGFLAAYADQTYLAGQKRLVRHGHLPEREVQTGIGAVPPLGQCFALACRAMGEGAPGAGMRRVRKPSGGWFSRRILRRANGSSSPRRSCRLIRCPAIAACSDERVRRAKSIEELLPWLYLKGISTGDFSDALTALLGPDAPGLSASTIARLKAGWRDDYERWSKRSVGTALCVFLDRRVYFTPRMDEDRQCMLVIIGADEWGNKDVLGLIDGFRESTQSWRELLLDLKRRGLEVAPKLAVGDGAMGFRAALHEVYGKTRVQRCWVHKTANELNAMPKSVQPKAKTHLKDICPFGHASHVLPGNRWQKSRPWQMSSSISSSKPTA